MTGQDTVHTVPAQVLMFINKRQENGAPASHQLLVNRNGQPTKPRTYHVVSRMGPNHNLGVFNNNVSSVERALLERYFLCDVNGTFHPPLAVAEDAYSTPALRAFRKAVVTYTAARAPVLTLRQVVACYTGGKRRVYEQALESLYRTALCRKDANLRPFTKFEKQALDKACRIINPRSPRYTLVLGKYLKKAEHIMFDAINEIWGAYTTHTVLKGVNVVEAAAVLHKKWMRFNNPVAIGLDAKKFDMHVSIPALQYEHSFYNNVFKSGELRKLLSWQLVNKGKAYCPDGSVDFRMPGTRSSGDLNTSLGNCIIMCSLIWAMCRELNVEAELCNNGDDCVLIVDAQHVGRVMETVATWFVRYGFRMEVETPVVDFERIVFCQSSPCWDGRNWRMVRDVRTCMKKDPMCLLPITNEKSLRKWMGAVGECGMALVPGIPVMRQFYSVFTRCGLKTTQRYREHVFRTTSMMERVDGLDGDWEPTPASRASFYVMTGLTPDVQLALEHYYSTLSVDTHDFRTGGEGCAENFPVPLLHHL